MGHAYKDNALNLSEKVLAGAIRVITREQNSFLIDKTA